MFISSFTLLSISILAGPATRCDNPYEPQPRAEFDGCRKTIRVSVDGDGQQLPEPQASYVEDMTPDGRFILIRSYGNLDPDVDTRGRMSLFVYDRFEERATIASLTESGELPNAAVTDADLSYDGRSVAFLTSATNMQSGTSFPAHQSHVYHRNLDTDTLTLVSKEDDELELGNYHPRISGDGRFVAYADTDLDGDLLPYTQIRVMNVETGWSRIVSFAYIPGEWANGNSWEPRLDYNGTYISFVSQATNLIADDTPTRGQCHLYRHGVRTDEIQRIDVTLDGDFDTDGDVLCDNIDMSDDGRYIVFSSNATNLIDDDRNGSVEDVFRADLLQDRIELVSESRDTAGANGWSMSPAMSTDGRYIVFASSATNLFFEPETATFYEAVVRDMQSGAYYRGNQASDGTLGNARTPSSWRVDPGISDDGMHVAFTANSDNLVLGDSNRTTDAFLHIHTPSADRWQPNQFYDMGDRVSYGENCIVYEARQAHFSFIGWEPPGLSVLWQRPTPPDNYEWQYQTHYLSGSIVLYNGNRYRSLHRHVSERGWEPSSAPALWQRF